MFRFFSMRVSSGWRMFALLVLGLTIAANPVKAQLGFGLSVTASPSPVAVSNSLTYTITVTNLTGISEYVLITNTLPALAQFQSASNPNGFYFLTNGNTVIFSFAFQLLYGDVEQMTVTALPTAVALITNSVFVVSGDLVYTASTNVVTQVTNVPPIEADLAVAINGPVTAIYTNDWMVYGVNVTNLGPNTAPNVFLTNTLPAGVEYIGASPSNKSYTASIQSSNVIFNLGTLTNQAFRNFQLTVQPTNAGALTFSSLVNSTTVLDPISANNLASTNITVSNYPPAQLSATIVSPQQYNPQNGLVEQSILVSNTGSNAVAATRVVVTGLNNQLYNALGTNSGNPFVVCAATLNTNQSVNLLLQYVAGAYFPFTNSQLNAFAVAVPNLAPPPVATVGTNLSISRIVHLATNGDVLIEFPSITNRTYIVVYSDNVLFSNAMIAPPAIIAPANRTQWIDYGPPTTTSHPTNAPSRFYRVFLNP